MAPDPPAATPQGTSTAGGAATAAVHPPGGEDSPLSVVGGVTTSGRLSPVAKRLRPEQQQQTPQVESLGKEASASGQLGSERRSSGGVTAEEERRRGLLCLPHSSPPAAPPCTFGQRVETDRPTTGRCEKTFIEDSLCCGETNRAPNTLLESGIRNYCTLDTGGSRVLGVESLDDVHTPRKGGAPARQASSLLHSTKSLSRSNSCCKRAAAALEEESVSSSSPFFKIDPFLSRSSTKNSSGRGSGCLSSPTVQLGPSTAEAVAGASEPVRSLSPSVRTGGPSSLPPCEQQQQQIRKRKDRHSTPGAETEKGGGTLTPATSNSRRTTSERDESRDFSSSALSRRTSKEVERFTARSPGAEENSVKRNGPMSPGISAPHMTFSVFLPSSSPPPSEGVCEDHLGGGHHRLGLKEGGEVSSPSFVACRTDSKKIVTQESCVCSQASSQPPPQHFPSPLSPAASSSCSASSHLIRPEKSIHLHSQQLSSTSRNKSSSNVSGLPTVAPPLLGGDTSPSRTICMAQVPSPRVSSGRSETSRSPEFCTCCEGNSLQQTVEYKPISTNQSSQSHNPQQDGGSVFGHTVAVTISHCCCEGTQDQIQDGTAVRLPQSPAASNNHNKCIKTKLVSLHPPPRKDFPSSKETLADDGNCISPSRRSLGESPSPSNICWETTRHSDCFSRFDSSSKSHGDKGVVYHNSDSSHRLSPSIHISGALPGDHNTVTQDTLVPSPSSLLLSPTSSVWLATPSSRQSTNQHHHPRVLLRSSCSSASTAVPSPQFGSQRSEVSAASSICRSRLVGATGGSASPGEGGQGDTNSPISVDWSPPFSCTAAPEQEEAERCLLLRLPRADAEERTGRSATAAVDSSCSAVGCLGLSQQQQQQHGGGQGQKRDRTRGGQHHPQPQQAQGQGQQGEVRLVVPLASLGSLQGLSEGEDLDATDAWGGAEPDAVVGESRTLLCQKLRPKKTGGGGGTKHGGDSRNSSGGGGNGQREGGTCSGRPDGAPLLLQLPIPARAPRHVHHYPAQAKLDGEEGRQEGSGGCLCRRSDEGLRRQSISGHDDFLGSAWTSSAKAAISGGSPEMKKIPGGACLLTSSTLASTSFGGEGGVCVLMGSSNTSLCTNERNHDGRCRSNTCMKSDLPTHLRGVPISSLDPAPSPSCRKQHRGSVQSDHSPLMQGGGGGTNGLRDEHSLYCDVAARRGSVEDSTKLAGLGSGKRGCQQRSSQRGECTGSGACSGGSSKTAKIPFSSITGTGTAAATKFLSSSDPVNCEGGGQSARGTNMLLFDSLRGPANKPVATASARVHQGSVSTGSTAGLSTPELSDRAETHTSSKCSAPHCHSPSYRFSSVSLSPLPPPSSPLSASPASPAPPLRSASRQPSLFLPLPRSSSAPVTGGEPLELPSSPDSLSFLPWGPGGVAQESQEDSELLHRRAQEATEAIERAAVRAKAQARQAVERAVAISAAAVAAKAARDAASVAAQGGLGRKMYTEYPDLTRNIHEDYNLFCAAPTLHSPGASPSRRNGRTAGQWDEEGRGHEQGETFGSAGGLHDDRTPEQRVERDFVMEQTCNSGRSWSLDKRRKEREGKGASSADMTKLHGEEGQTVLPSGVDMDLGSRRESVTRGVTTEKLSRSSDIWCHQEKEDTMSISPFISEGEKEVKNVRPRHTTSIARAEPRGAEEVDMIEESTVQTCIDIIQPKEACYPRIGGEEEQEIPHLNQQGSLSKTTLSTADTQRGRKDKVSVAGRGEVLQRAYRGCTEIEGSRLEGEENLSSCVTRACTQDDGPSHFRESCCRSTSSIPPCTTSPWGVLEGDEKERRTSQIEVCLKKGLSSDSNDSRGHEAGSLTPPGREEDVSTSLNKVSRRSSGSQSKSKKQCSMKTKEASSSETQYCECYEENYGPVTKRGGGSRSIREKKSSASSQSGGKQRRQSEEEKRKGHLVLGEGRFGKVVLAEQRATQRAVAVKMIDKRKLRGSGADEWNFRQEVEMHRRLPTHRNIVSVCDVYEDRDTLYLILAAVMHCHNHNVVHRDLKPENILFARNPPSSSYPARHPGPSPSLHPCCQRDLLNMSPISKNFSSNSSSAWRSPPPSLSTCACHENVIPRCCCEGPYQRHPSSCASAACGCRLPFSSHNSPIPCDHHLLRCSSSSTCTGSADPSASAPSHLVQGGHHDHHGGHPQDPCWSRVERTCRSFDSVTDGRRCWCSSSSGPFLFHPQSTNSQATLDCVEKRHEDEEEDLVEVLNSQHNSNCCCSRRLRQRRLTSRRSDEGEGGRGWGGCCRFCGVGAGDSSDLKSQRLERRREFLSSATVKIVDFGAACASTRGQLRGTACGTVHYLAPEVLMGNYYDGFASDAWSLGVILFTMLAAAPPFNAHTHAQLIRQIIRGDYRMSGPVWWRVSVEAKDLISRLLAVNPQNRLTVNEAAHHPWIVRAAPPAFPSFFLSNPHCLSSLATGVATAVTPSTLYDLTSSSYHLCSSHSCCLHCTAAHQSHLCPCEWPPTAPTTTSGCSALASWLALTGSDVACQDSLLPASAASSSSACPHHSCACGCEPPLAWRPSCVCVDTCNRSSSSISNTSLPTACPCRASRRRPSSSTKSGATTTTDKMDKILARHHHADFLDSHCVAAEVSTNCDKHFAKSAGGACEETASIEMQHSLHRTLLSESWEDGAGGKDHQDMSPISQTIVEPLPPPRSQQLGSDFLGCTPVPAAGDTRLSSPTSKSRQERVVSHRESRSDRRKNRCGNTFSNSSSHGARSIASEDSDFLSTDTIASNGLQPTKQQQQQHVSRGECVGASFFSTSDARSIGRTAGVSTCFSGDSEHRVVTRKEYEQSIGREKQQLQLQQLAASSLAPCKSGPPREDAWMDE
ncbi:cam cdpk family [Cystoisospora suis]|uniref:Cam cdpk family n=1 Tax=Cystoisospora suis TaxID=483139 RepID=A0A2C6L5Z0_9APIC|nr:cam cdpk family [Cystoisospora suis]